MTSRPPVHYRTDDLTIRKLCVGPLENNAYLLECRRTGDTLVIDAADEAERILAALGGNRLVAIATTHGHWDHVQAAADVASATGAPLLISPADAAMVDHPSASLDEGPIEVGAATVEAIATPGHTPGSMCLLVDGAVFSGDTLFPGGPGATAGPSEFDRIMESLQARLFTMDDDTLVFPGHGLDTTIGTERPHLAAWRRRGW